MIQKKLIDFSCCTVPIILEILSVKIDCVNEKNEVINNGTGTLFSNGGSYYILTAAHCIQLDDTTNHFDTTNIRISLPRFDYTIEVNDVLIFNPEDEIDFALLSVKIDTDIFPVDFDYENGIRFIRNDGILAGKYLYAYTSINPEGRMFTIHMVSSDTYAIEDGISTNGADFLSAMKGSSGGGIFVDFNNRIYCLGYVKSHISGVNKLDDIKICRIPNDISKILGCQFLKQSVQDVSLIDRETDKKATETDSLLMGNAAQPHSKITTASKPHPQAIDLGLSVKWASCNVGATKPEEPGGYFAWGETEEKKVKGYDWITYVHCNGSSNSCQNLGSDIAGTKYDVAHLVWGESWMMPTPEQFKELLDNCDCNWVDQNGVKGCEFRSKRNNERIFLPAAGYYLNNDPHDVGRSGRYWSSINHSPCYSHYLYLDKSDIADLTICSRDNGLCIRPILSHPQVIDLGLSVKWASCNLGATKPEEYGDYFAWGETEEKKIYNEKTYVHNVGRLIKSYRNLGGDIAGTQYDVAHVKWGDNWRMPTIEQIKELLNNCDTEWIEINGVKGRKFTSKCNGKSIFLPAAGYRDGSSLIYAGMDGLYWSSAQGPSCSGYAYYLSFLSGNAYWSSGYRYNGRPVRPVSRI